MGKGGSRPGEHPREGTGGRPCETQRSRNNRNSHTGIEALCVISTPIQIHSNLLVQGWERHANAHVTFVGFDMVDLAKFGAAQHANLLQCDECLAFNIPSDDFCLCCLARLRKKQEALSVGALAARKERIKAFEQSFLA